MLGRIVEISGEGRRLTLDRGFLSISGPDGLLGQVPLDDIEAVIAANPAITYSNQALAALAARGAPVVICAPTYVPAAYLLPVNGHHAQGALARRPFRVSGGVFDDGGGRARSASGNARLSPCHEIVLAIEALSTGLVVGRAAANGRVLRERLRREPQSVSVTDELGGGRAAQVLGLWGQGCRRHVHRCPR